MTEAFSTEQQDYLSGLLAGVIARGGPIGGRSGGALDPLDLQRAAQDRVVAAGGKLTAEEEAKRAKHPLDRFADLARSSAEGRYPKGTETFLTKFFGLFYAAPAQNSFMCRLRIPGGILNSFQLCGVATIAEELGGGFVDVTTRANLQIREINAEDGPEVVTRLVDIGLTSRGSGADNVRNVTGSPTAGIDPHELIDTRPDTRRIHHHILNHRELFGLPRKFNIAFDGGGAVPVLQDTNDIGFTAVRVADGHGVKAGVYYRLALGGITGHRDFARPTGIIVAPADTVAVCDAILRVFIAHGDRTDRTKARLKYLLDDWGFDRFCGAVEAELGRPLMRVADAALTGAERQQGSLHVGVHGQVQTGLSYIGVALPVGRVTAERMRGLADVATRFGSGTIRLTVWQNLLISDIPNDRLHEAVAAVEALGLRCDASALRTGLVACTGNAGCKFSASDTKRHGNALVEWLERRITVDQPINIHVTGCHHSCAQHFIGDIGLLGVKVERGDDLIEGYDLHVGGSAGPKQAIGRLIKSGIPVDELPPAVLSLLSTWMANRVGGETFQSWCGKLSDAGLGGLCESAVAEAA